MTSRIRLQIASRIRDLALLNLAIDSKLRGCDLVRLRVRDVAHDEHIVSRASVMQQKTGQPVRFELTEQTRDAVQAWIVMKRLSAGDYRFPSRHRQSPHVSTRQYARIVTKRIESNVSQFIRTRQYNDNLDGEKTLEWFSSVSVNVSAH